MRILAALMLALPLAKGAVADDRPALELSLDDAVKRALENNADIAVEKYNPEIGAQNVRGAQGIYDPFLSTTLRQSRRTDPPSSAFSGGDKVETDTFTYNVGISQYLPTGGSFGLSFNNFRQDTNNVFSTFNPAYSSTLSLNVTQPLLRNFRLDSSRLNLRVARKNREITDLQFRQTVVNTVANVKQLYYDLLYAMDNLEAQRKSLSLATKLLEENRIKVRVGTMAPLDVVAAESEVASREEGVIVAENTLLEAEDAVKRSIFPKNDPSTWDLRIVPTDRPTADTVGPGTVDTQGAIANALEKRTDLVAARKGLERADISLDYARSQKLPQVDLVASYGTTGLGGNQITRDGFGGPIIDIVPGGYGDALSDVFGREFPTWSIGVNLSYSLGNRQAAAAAAEARISKDQAVANLRRLELQVASEVRSAARAVETNYKRVESTRAARVLTERRLDAEEKKFAAGMSTNFQVTQAQRDLAVADVAELRAVADYRKSLINLDRVQEAGGGSASSFLASASGGSSSASRGASSSASSAQSFQDGQ
jgi:outer membrane protein TolC